MSRAILLALGVAACSGDGVVDPVSRGGLAVRVVVAEADPRPCDETDDDDDDDERTTVVFTSLEIDLDEFRLTVGDDDDDENDASSFSVPVSRTVDLVGPASSEDEIVLDLEYGDYSGAVAEVVARPGDGATALRAEGIACISDDDDLEERPVQVVVPDQLSLVSEPVRLLIGNGPDPRLKLGLIVRDWLDDIEPPDDDLEEPWVVGDRPDDLETLLENIHDSVVTEVD